MTTIGFYYNQALCAGCKVCQVACKDKNKLEVGVLTREVRSYQIGTYPQVTMYHFSAGCNHCDTPACMSVCPADAYEKREDGTVVQNPEKCIGCQSCVNACPFEVPRFDEGNAVTRKCDGCYDLREAGYEPHCVEACPFRALEFGDMDELTAKHPNAEHVMIPAMGSGETGPNLLIEARSEAKRELGEQILL